MSDTKIVYELREYFESGSFYIRKTGETESELRLAAEKMAADNDREFKIVSVITTETTLDIFTVPAIVYSLEDIADQLSAVYAGTVDWENEHYVKLSAADKQKVADMVDVDSCHNCGWEFESQYLSFNDYGNICDRCESDLAEEEEELEDEE